MKISHALSHVLAVFHALLPLTIQGEQLKQDYSLLVVDAALVKFLKELEHADATNIKRKNKKDEPEDKN